MAGADERGWHGWAFELRDDEMVGWIGAWTPAGCEARRRQALGDQVDAVIGLCQAVTLIDEPTGVSMWAIALDESGFVAASTSEICEDEPPADAPIRPVVSTCLRVWLRLPV
jgi:hypothetical protein